MNNINSQTQVRPRAVETCLLNLIHMCNIFVAFVLWRRCWIFLHNRFEVCWSWFFQRFSECVNTSVETNYLGGGLYLSIKVLSLKVTSLSMKGSAVLICKTRVTVFQSATSQRDKLSSSGGKMTTNTFLLDQIWIMTSWIKTCCVSFFFFFVFNKPPTPFLPSLFCFGEVTLFEHKL